MTIIKNKDIPRVSQENSPTARTYIGANISVKGELTGGADLVVAGRFQGKIALKGNDLVIEPGGQVEAEVEIKNLTIKGSLKGNIHANGLVLIEKDGQLTGDIAASRLSIIEGAVFKGSVKMNSTPG